MSRPQEHECLCEGVEEEVKEMNEEVGGGEGKRR